MSDFKIDGFTHDRFAAARPAFAGNFMTGADIGASYCATLEGETVVDLWGGFADEARTRPWERDTIVNVYSTTKTMTALSALLLADRGDLDFSAPVARYWPEFAANGKSGVTVAMLMSHSAGLSGWTAPMTPDDLYDWEKATSLLAAQAPLWAPGSAIGYHAVTQGYLVGEVVRREMRREGVGQAQQRGQLRAIGGGAENPASHRKPRAGHRLDALAGLGRGEIAHQLHHIAGEVVAVAGQVAAHRIGRGLVGPRRAAQAEVDPPGMQRRQRAVARGQARPTSGG